MTTEAGSETEVKEKAEEPAAEPVQSEKAPDEAQEVANAEGQEKGKEGKGIGRYLPTWLKKQKSQSQQTSPTKEAPPTEEAVGKVTQQKGDESAPEVNGHAEEVEEEEEEEEKEEAVKSEEVKEKESESHSTASGDNKTAKAEETADKVPEESQPTAEGEGAKEVQQKKEQEGDAAGEEEQGGEREGQTSIFQSPLRLVRKTKMKLMECHVSLLDGTDFTCEVEKRAKGQFLFFKVCEHLNLMEKDYFGLFYMDNHAQTCWLDPTKDIKRQIRNNNWQFVFNVKFYPPDPSLLTEDITRYLLCLQLREDVATGRLPCSFVTHALLGSYTLQAEFGDHEPDQPRPLDNVGQLTFAPNQNKDMEEKILELHKSLRGMTPAQADAQFLENAKKLSMYGVDLHHAKDSEGVDIMLGVCANGLLVYKDRLRINRFAWPKILKISYKRNNFYIKIRPGETEQFESTVGFKLQNHRSAKRLWKVCVENHSFFRLTVPEQPTKARFLTLGSKFRYSGRTQAQTRKASSLIDRPAPNFQRTSSKRISRSLDGAPMISITEASENGREPHLELHSDSKESPAPPVEAAAAAAAENSIADTKEAAKTTEVEIEETVVVQEVSIAPKLGRVAVTAGPPAGPPAHQEALEQEVTVQEEVVVNEEAKAAKQESVSSESESEEEAEYHPNVSICHTQIPEEEEEEEEEQQEEEAVKAAEAPSLLPVAASLPEDAREEKNAEGEHQAEREATEGEAPNGPPAPEGSASGAEREEGPKVNGDARPVEAEHRPQVICCSEPPVVKTEMVTISDTFAAQKTEIATKEVPIVHTETKTITYEAAQLDGNGDGEPGVLMTAQTITSESLCTTTTTHITKTLKGGLSETRIEKRIVITGDCDIDHDQALAQAIKEAKEQHPDMSVTRVVVHKETELAEEEED
ncbi:band 4.1-like protein 2 isoform X9 [Pungitius pungitius]|uniref:band 4.1-like protein 2 isoform X9 n=1 Tax=Pungitius pungitius TaxID=134920 RepID=UPI002E0E0ED8